MSEPQIDYSLVQTEVRFIGRLTGALESTRRKVRGVGPCVVVERAIATSPAAPRIESTIQNYQIEVGGARDIIFDRVEFLVSDELLRTVTLCASRPRMPAPECRVTAVLEIAPTVVFERMES